MNVAFFDAKPYDRRSFDHVAPEYGVTIKYFEDRLSPDSAIMAKGFDTVCAFVNDVLSAEVLDTLAGLGVKLVALRCAGYNQVDLKAAYRRVHVVRVPAYSPYAVAEHAVALIMALNRKTHRAYYRIRDNNFAIHGLLGFDMHGKTAGIVGAGKIGRVLAGILKGFGMRVLAYDPFPPKDRAETPDLEFVSLDELYRQSDILSLHCPLTPENVHMINRESIARMKPGIMLINTGRGKLIDSRALIQGLKSSRVGSAGLDVYEEETEYFFEDFSAGGIEDDVLARLMTFPNVLITSHQAFFTQEALENIARTTLENIRLFHERNELPNEICYRCGDDTCARQETGRCF